MLRASTLAHCLEAGLAADTANRGKRNPYWRARSRAGARRPYLVDLGAGPLWPPPRAGAGSASTSSSAPLLVAPARRYRHSGAHTRQLHGDFGRRAAQGGSVYASRAVSRTVALREKTIASQRPRRGRSGSSAACPLAGRAIALKRPTAG